ncbi:MAG: Na+/H+ antiporter NhaA [Bacteroidales bacterium]|nr:Na+/H+ antiporter NhaA [Bacteroidales bacterium]
MSALKKVVQTPFQKFIRIESLSGMLLFGATLLALILANSPWAGSFQSFWQYKVGISTTGFELIKPLILWINDGLMAIFFFLIGLEIKRELLIGELNSVKKASFPLFAAIGGMLVPVALFLVLNRNLENSHAWGIPMATDIAFSLAILRLLGNRVPLGLKVFLTAFAIVDDLGAVMVIALFYSGSIQWTLIAIASVLLAILFFLSYKQIHAKGLIFFFGIIIWVLFLKAGIHPTIAGVLLAFTVPIRQKIGVATYYEKLCEIVDDIKASDKPGSPLLTKQQIENIDHLEDWTEKVQSPLQLLEHRLHNWVAYLIMPLFALSNAGVAFKGGGNLDLSLGGIIVICLVAGKLIGVILFSWIGVKLGFAELPAEVNFKQITGIALLAGVGFTMSIFVANLAFGDNPFLLESSKAGILVGSFIAGISGYLVLRFNSKKPGKT